MNKGLFKQTLINETDRQSNGRTSEFIEEVRKAMLDTAKENKKTHCCCIKIKSYESEIFQSFLSDFVEQGFHVVVFKDSKLGMHEIVFSWVDEMEIKTNKKV